MDFQGFQNNISPLLMFVLAIALIALAFYSYQRQKNLSNSRKLLLGSLRSASFLVILVLVLNPFFFSTKEVEKKPSYHGNAG